MQFLFLFIVFNLFFYGTHLQAGKGFSEDGKVLDLSEVFTAKKASSSIGVVEDIIETHITPKFNQLSNIRIIDLSFNKMHQDTLNSFVSSLKSKEYWQIFQNVEIIYLRNNNFDATITPTLVEFLTLNRHVDSSKKMFPYIDIVETPLAVSHVAEIAQKLIIPENDVDNFEVPLLMEHLIFLKKNYIRDASNRVSIYKQFVKKSFLPSNWPIIQRNYYNSLSYKDFLTYKKKQADKNWANFIQSILPESQTSTGSSEIINVDDLATQINNISISIATSPHESLK